jgi:glycosyltransferase involved in cell wall biosynthesis
MKGIANHFHRVFILRHDKRKSSRVTFETDPEDSSIVLITISGDALSRQLRTLQTIQRISPSLVISDTLSDTGIAAASLLLSGVRLITFVRGYDRNIAVGMIESKYGKFASRFADLILYLRDAFVFQRSDVVFTVTEALALYVRKFIRSGAQRICHLPRSLDYCATIPKEAHDRVSMLMSDLNASISPDVVVISIVANLVKPKKVDVALEALKHLKRDLSDVVLLVAGNGPDLRRLQQLALKLNLRDSVVFLGRIPREDVLALYQVSHLVLFTSTSEGSARALHEALAMGCPVVSYRFRGAKELGLEEFCLFIEDLDAVLYAKAALRIIRDTSLREQLVNAGLTLSRAYVSRSNLARIELMVRILETAIGNE